VDVFAQHIHRVLRGGVPAETADRESGSGA
jgi:hypothetical protein